MAGEGRYGLPQPYLKRLMYRSWEGQLSFAWTATELGYYVAERVLPEPPKVPTANVGAAFIEHDLALNELYVRLLEVPLKSELAALRERAQREPNPTKAFERLKARVYARAAQPQFRWNAGDTVRLPWRQYDEKAGKTRDRLIVPDAVLELPGQRRRFFLEFETGAHTIAAASDEKRGATVAKLERYDEYLSGLAGNDARQTHYRASYPDDFEPGLLFLVRSGARQSSINRAIVEWREGRAGKPLRAQALTVEVAMAEFLKVVGYSPVPAEQATARPRHAVTSGELRLVREFYNSAVRELKAVRAEARARRGPVPAYPEETERMGALLEKLGAG